MIDHATLGGHEFRINPDHVRWSYHMKVAERLTLGGKVIQILGTRLDSMIVGGDFGMGDPDHGDAEGWEQQRRFIAWVQSQVERAQSTRHPAPLEFTYAPRNWRMRVYIEQFATKEGNFEYRNEVINPSWQLTLFILQDLSRVVVQGIQDLYIKRLMNGIGWKQTAYNGPPQTYVDQLLGGRTYGEYLGDEADAIFNQGLNGIQLPGGGRFQ